MMNGYVAVLQLIIDVVFDYRYGCYHFKLRENI